MAEPMMTDPGAELWQELHKHAQHLVDQTSERLNAQGFRTTKLVVDGDIAGEIIDRATHTAANLVAIGGHGENAFTALLLGSVARKLVSHSPCSILIARTYEDKTPSESADILKAKPALTALIAVDDSPGSNAAVEAFKKYGEGYDQIFTLSVRPLPVYPVGIAPMIAAMQVDDQNDDVLPIAERAAEELKGLAPRVEAMRAHGHPSFEINRAAKEVGADLVVVGATRHGFIERFLIGSVAYDVACGAPCTALVIRP
jgi:nucleotide-binding universal stress UspA family protein